MTKPKPQPDQPQPPAHLSEESQDWFARVVGDFALEGHHLRLLQLACEAWDAAQAARAALAEHGRVYVDRFGQPAARPEVKIEIDNRTSFARLLRELALDIAAPEAPRPTMLPGRAGRK